MELTVNEEENIEDFKKKWGNPRDTNSVQEITLQHLETES